MVTLDARRAYEAGKLAKKYAQVINDEIKVLLQAGIASLRMVTGVVQFLPGLALLPFEADLPGSYDYFSRGRALVEGENPLADSPIRYVPPLTALTIDPRFGVITELVLDDPP